MPPPPGGRCAGLRMRADRARGIEAGRAPLARRGAASDCGQGMAPTGRGAFRTERQSQRGAHGNGQSKWGRHCCRPHSHRRVDSPCLQGFRRTFSRCLRGAMLGARCLAPRRLAPCGARAEDLSPALAPASGFRSLAAALPLPKGSGVRGPARGLGRGRVPLPAVPAPDRLSPLCPVPARPGSWPVRRHRVAPILGVNPLAFGQGLLQENSRSARGQMPPPSLG